MMRLANRTFLTFGLFLFLLWHLLGSSLLLPAAQYGTGPVKPAPGQFAWPAGKKAALSLSFDDARPSQVDVGFPLFQKYGVKATFYVSPDRMTERLAGWKQVVAAGHEIGNHSVVHPCSGNFPWSRARALEDYTPEQMQRELEEANRLIQAKLGILPQTFAYPCGQKFVGRGVSLKSTVPLAAYLFTASRGFMDEVANDPSYCDLAQLLGTPSDNRPFSEVRPLLDQALESGGWLVLAGHEIGEGNTPQTTQVSFLKELIEYSRDPSRQIWLDTVAAVAAHVATQRGAAGSPSPVYLDPARPIAVRVEDLLQRMTLEEKIGQMNMPCVYEEKLGRDVAAKLEACRKFTAGEYVKELGPGGGFFTLADNILPKHAREQAEYFNELQQIARKTRLGIPLLQTEEGTHGLMCSDSTIFPEGLALGSTWNPDLIRKIYSTVAREARARGIHQLFTLVVEPNRDPRLGRNQEGYGEDPYLLSRWAEMIVEGAQGDDVAAGDKAVAGLCHYPGQSQPASGLERGAMEISERQLRETFLPSWVAGIKKKGALGVMATYPAIDAIPTHASDWILTRILRQELNFQGLVLSEGGGIGTLIYEGLAPTMKEAGALALKAGLDVGISYESGYMEDLVENVRSGKVPMELVDRAVRRILTQKFRLGLFEKPLVDPEHARQTAHTQEHQDLALEAAREGIVLLKNTGPLLPLKKNLKSIAVIGPNADNAANQLGDYTPKTILHPIVTILEGIKHKVGASTRVDYLKGCEVIGEGVNEIAQAKALAAKAEVAIVVVGENEREAEGKMGTNGEGFDAATLELTGKQEELVKAVVESGTPTVVVLINGRPLAVRWIAENVPALVEAWLPGERGGEAVADVLFGDSNPSGRLSITVPRHVGQLPVYYNYKPSKHHWLKEGWGKPYVDLDPEPLYEFGFGLSYTQFAYRDLEITPGKISRGGRVSVRLEVENSGSRAGDEVVQLYLRDPVSSVVTPIKQLRGFQKMRLAPGEKKKVEFLLLPEHLALLNRHLEWEVEPGQFEVMVGSSSKAIHLSGRFEVLE
jgi:beta-glucosidase